MRGRRWISRGRVHRITGSAGNTERQRPSRSFRRRAPYIHLHVNLFPAHNKGSFKNRNRLGSLIMNRQSSFSGRTEQPAMFIARYGTVVAVLLSVCTTACSAETKQGSLREVYKEAAQLAQTAEGLEEGISKYKSVIEMHRANDKVFRSALRGLAKCYADSGRADDGIRFFISLAYESWATDQRDTLREILHEFGLKHPELMERVAADMRLSSEQKPRIAPAAPSKQLADAVLQREDKLLRQESLERLREMLSPDSSVADKKSALATLRSSLSAKFDRDPFRFLVLPLLKSEDEEIRMLALRCLPGLGATSQVLSLVIPMADDASARVRMNAAGALIQLAKGEEKQKVVPALMKLLQDDDPDVVEQSIRSMWGQYCSPEFDRQLIELSRDPRYHHNVIYFGLSTMRSKSVAVCRRLVEELDDPDWNNSGRAAWGLTYGVTDEAKSVVEEGLLRALPEEMNPYTRRQEFRALRQVTTEKSRAYLRSVADSEMETEEFRKLARDILTDMDRRP